MKQVKSFARAGALIAILALQAGAQAASQPAKPASGQKQANTQKKVQAVKPKASAAKASTAKSGAAAEAGCPDCVAKKKAAPKPACACCVKPADSQSKESGGKHKH